MKLDDDKEAIAILKNGLGSYENRARAIYNKGYKAGFEDGKRDAIERLMDSLYADRKTEPQTSSTPYKVDTSSVCKTEPQEYVEYDLGNGYHARYEIRKTDPQIDRWSEEEHKAFYTFLWNTIDPNEMEDYIQMFEGKSEPQTDCSWK